MKTKVKVWTKQHKDILNVLEKEGRYIVKKEYIQQKMEDHANLYLDVYDWYRHAAGKIIPAPADVKYPIWVSLAAEEKIENSEGNVLLELEVDETLLLTMDIDKWGRIVNNMYIPLHEQDEDKHDQMLARYSIDDHTAYMTPFYPNIKQEIVRSWDRLFDETIVLSKMMVGTLWELKKDWIVNVSK